METTSDTIAPEYPSPHAQDDNEEKRGRPTLYSQELADYICDQVANGLSINKLSQKENMPAPSTVCKWQKEIPSFYEHYTLAREIRADSRADYIDDIAAKLLAGEITSDVARVLIETEKWQASKENFKRYGDKQAIEQTNTHNHNVVISDMSTASLLAELQRTATALPGGVKLKGDKLEISTDYVDVTPKEP